MKNGIELIAIERQEQIEKHGRTIESDVLYNKHYQLVNTAKHLLNIFEEYDESDMELAPDDWDKKIYRKMLLKPYKERLIIAGALIAAEIDRLQNT